MSNKLNDLYKKLVRNHVSVSEDKHQRNQTINIRNLSKIMFLLMKMSPEGIKLFTVEALWEIRAQANDDR